MKTRSPENSQTRQLARFAANLRYEDLPQEVIDHAKVIMIDTIGAGLYGSTLPWCRILADYVQEMGGKPCSTVWGNSYKTSAANAALANSTMVHSFELDDLLKDSGFHGGGLATCAALAVSEDNASISGKDLITAIVAGFEVGGRIGECVCSAGHGHKGFHPTGTIGAFVSAATVGKMLGLDEEKMIHCLGIGGTQGAGLLSAQYGAMVKRMHAGRAAQSGVYAGQLAQKGFTGANNILESPYGGFVSALTTQPYDLSILTRGLDKHEFVILNDGFKPYSSCASTHSAIDSIGYLMDQNGITVDMIDKINVKCSSVSKDHVGFEYIPEGMTGAQMNMYYTIAVRVMEGDVFVDQFTEEKVKDPKILDFIRDHINIVADPEIDAEGARARHKIKMQLITKSGNVLEETRYAAKGSYHYPMSNEEVFNKYRRLASKALETERIKQIFDAVMSVDKFDDTRVLARLMGM